MLSGHRRRGEVAGEISGEGFINEPHAKDKAFRARLAAASKGASADMPSPLQAAPGSSPNLKQVDPRLIGGERGQLAPHISKQGPMPGVAYGKSSSALAGVDADERQRIDRSMKQQVDIKGSAGIKIEVSAPKGTKVGAQADGVFKKTEISRSQQMEPSAVSSGGEE